MYWRARAEGLEQPWHDVDLNIVFTESADELERLLMTVAGKRDDDPIDLVAIDNGLDLVGLPNHLGALQVPAHLFRCGVDEADHVDPVLGMLVQLAPNQLTDVTRADDHRVLNVRTLPPGDRSRRGPHPDDAH